MAVFYDTGGGDIYGGPDRESVLKAMREDYSYIDEEDIFEVAGTKKMFIEGEDGEATEELTTA